MKISINNFNVVTILITVINWVVGLRVIERPEGHLRPYWTLILIFFWMSMYVSAIIFNRDSVTPQFNPRTESIVFMFISIGSVITLICMTSLGFCYSKLLKNFKKKMDLVDRSLLQLGSLENYRKVFYGILFVTAVWFSLVPITGRFYFQWISSRSSLIAALHLGVTYAYASNLGSIVLLDFAVCIYWLGTRFKKINGILETLAVDDLRIIDEKYDNLNAREKMRKKVRIQIDNWMRINPVASRSLLSKMREDREKDERMRHLLQVIRLIYLDLCTASKMLCTVFNAQLSLQLRMDMFYITICLYYSYVIFRNEDNVFGETMQLSMATGLNTIAYCVKVAFVSHFCENVTQEGNRVLELIHSCSKTEGISDETMNELRQFALQMSQMNLGRAGKGYFELNYHFVRQYIVSITTYVLIMIQMTRWTMPSSKLSTINWNTTHENQI